MRWCRWCRSENIVTVIDDLGDFVYCGDCKKKSNLVISDETFRATYSGSDPMRTAFSDIADRALREAADRLMKEALRGRQNSGTN